MSGENKPGESWIPVGIVSPLADGSNIRSAPSTASKIVGKLTADLRGCEMNVEYVSTSQPPWRQFRDEAGTDSFYVRSDVMQFGRLPMVDIFKALKAAEARIAALEQEFSDWKTTHTGD